MDSSSKVAIPVAAGVVGAGVVVDPSAAAAAAAAARASSSSFGTSPTGGSSSLPQQLGPAAIPAPLARGTGHRLWVHAPAIPENLLDEYFSGFGSVVDVYCPRDAQ